ncbi:MAG: pyridoxal phosphate-dependent aminotransferase family protein [Bacillota bacterium]|nr:pyridoxal phosphate-dependent aminotransferase family protein [Bacillota bacterium]
MPLFKKCDAPSLANELREKGVYPYHHELESRQDAEVIMEGKRRIMLGSNNYLGLTVDPEVTEAGIQAIRQYGTGCSGSRFLNGTLKLHTELEKTLAAFTGYESAIVFSTGFQSNLGLLAAIVGRNDTAICDRENHASIYDGCKLSFGRMTRYHHNDMGDLEAKLACLPLDSGKLIVTDGVFSMSGDVCRLPDIVELAEKYQARVLVDDAHGLGVIGPGGRGTAAYFGLTDRVDLTMGTFSKSLASLGGFCAGSERVVDFIRHSSRPYIFSASITPASCATALAALRVIEREPERVERLHSLAAYLRKGLRKRGVPILEAATPIVPFYTYEVYDTLDIARELYDRGVYVNPVLPPACVPGECLLRCSLMATLTEALLDEATEIIASVMDARGLTRK